MVRPLEPLSLTRSDGLTLSEDADRIDRDRVAGWLGSSYWAAGRSRDTIERSIEGSCVYGVYRADTQVAFARAVTDRATFCWIADVIVDEAVRGRGIGRWLVSTILEQLRAEGVQRFVLATRDAHGVYEHSGFTSLRVPAIWMEIDSRANRPEPSDVTVRSTARATDRESARPTS